MKVLPPFDPAARCPKCAFDAVTTYYVAPEWRHIPWPDQMNPPMEIDEWLAFEAIENAKPPLVAERLKRSCARCGFHWFEACVFVDGMVSS